MLNNIVKAAFDHIQSKYPDVVLVVYAKNQTWCYMTEDWSAPQFQDVDVGLLEDAMDSIESHNLPFVYQP